MKHVLYLALLFSIISCGKKDLKLPQLHIKAVNEVYNNSAVWVFYTLDGKDTLATLNRNNSISTTHWLFNIDRRLQLKQIYKPLSTMLAKRQDKSSPHHVDGMLNYFTFADTIDKRNKFLPLTTKSITYKNPNLKDTASVDIIFYPTSFKLKNNNYNYNQLDSVLQNKSDLGQTQFYFQDNLSYTKYLWVKSKIYNLSLNYFK